MLGLFLDFEATDKDTNTARIVQVAFSLYNLHLQKELCHDSHLVLPEGNFAFDPVAAKITGITVEQLQQYGRSLTYTVQLLEKLFTNCEYIIAHNLHQYDLPLFKNELKRLGREDFYLPKLIDTRFDIPWPEHIETRKLTYLGAEYGVVNPSAHSARHDVDLMAKLFFQFPLNDIIDRSQSPMVWVRANVSYDHREKAKAEKFLWDGNNKWWVKFFKQCDLEKKNFDFTTTILKDYKGL